MAETSTTALRPIERCVLRLHAEGHDHAEIGRRFRKRPATIGRIIDMTDVRHRRARTAPSTTLRPVERRVLRWLDAGMDHAEIGRRFRRHPNHIARVETFARLKLRGARPISSPG